MASYIGSQPSSYSPGQLTHRGPGPEISPALRSLQQKYDHDQKRLENICRLFVCAGLAGLALWFFNGTGSGPGSASFGGQDADGGHSFDNPTPQMYAHLQDQVRFQPQTGVLPISPVVLFTCMAALLVGYQIVKTPATGAQAAARTSMALVPHGPPPIPSGPLVDLRPGEAYRVNTLWGGANPTPINGQHYGAQPGAPGTNPATGSSSSVAAELPVPSKFVSKLGASIFGFNSSPKYDDQLVRQEFPAVPWIAQQLEAMVQSSIIPPLLQQLRESDDLWTTGLRRIGKTLSFEAVDGRTGDRQNFNIVSVFDRNLPGELAQDQTAVHAWKRRQEMEVYLCHPGFPPSSRNYVLNRITAWVGGAAVGPGSRGRQPAGSVGGPSAFGASSAASASSSAFRRSYQAEHADPMSRITDSHILENLLIKTLESHLGHQFAARYMTASGGGSGRGSSASVSSGSRGGLAGVTSSGAIQNMNGGVGASNVCLRSFRLPSGAVSYEVVVASARVFRLQNLLDAFALFFWLKRHDLDWQQFPMGILTVVRDAENMFAERYGAGGGAGASHSTTGILKNNVNIMGAPQAAGGFPGTMSMQQQQFGGSTIGGGSMLTSPADSQYLNMMGGGAAAYRGIFR
eukprot:g11490.t1